MHTQPFRLKPATPHLRTPPHRSCGFILHCGTTTEHTVQTPSTRFLLLCEYSFPPRVVYASVTSASHRYHSCGITVGTVANRCDAMSDVPTPFTPTCATTPRYGATWQPVNECREVIVIRGGYSTKPEILPCLTYRVGQTTHKFVLLDKNAFWFLRCVGGKSARKGDLKCVKVLDQIRTRFHAAEVDDQCGDADTPPVAATTVADEADDPMNMMAEFMNSTCPVDDKQPQRYRIRPRLFTRLEAVRTIAMPSRPPCTAVAGAANIDIHIYKKPATTGRSTRARLYLQSDDIPWLLAYAADELHHQGITPTDESDTLVKKNTKQLGCDRRAFTVGLHRTNVDC